VKKIKILLIGDTESIYFINLINSLLVNKNLDIHVITFDINKCNIKGIFLHKLHLYKLRKLGYLFTIFRLNKIVKQVNPDLINAHYITSYGFLSAFANFHCKPLILTAWGSDVLETAMSPLFLIRHLIRIFTVNNCTHIIAVSPHISSEIKKLVYNYKVKISNIPFGYSSDIFFTASRTSSPTLNIVATRNLYKVYSISTIVQAIKILRDKNFNFHLHLIGDGPLKRDILSKINQFQLNNFVSFYGSLDQNSLACILRRCDVYVSASLSDGTSASLLEAFASSCFPIVSNINANAQFIKHRVNGLLFKPGDFQKLAQLIFRIDRNSQFFKDTIRFNEDLVSKSYKQDFLSKKIVNQYLEIINGNF